MITLILLQRGAGGRHQFERLIDLGYGESLEEFHRGRRGVGEHAVGALDDAVPAGKRADRYGIHSEPVQPGAAADDVDDGIQGADLVDVDLVGRCAMHSGLGLRDAFEDSEAGGLDRRGQCGALDHAADIGQASPVVMVGLGCMDRDLGAGEVVRRDAAGLDAEALDLELRDILLEFARVDAESGERPEDHIAAGSADAFEVQDFHAGGSPTRLMRAAVTPAPNPLSMLTTEMPGTQVLSMARRAAMPCRLAP